MGIFRSNSQIIMPIRQRITVNGSVSAALECLSISRDTAEFEVPEMLYDTWRERYRDAFVTLEAGGLFEGGNGSVWSGYLDTDSAALGDNEDSVKFSAISVTGYLNKVWVGQTQLRPVVVYTLAENYTCRDILEDLFENLPTSLGARIRLGDTRVLDGALVIAPADGEEATQRPPQITFRDSTYASALDQIIGYFGDVAYRLRYDGVMCYLDFYRVQSVGAPSTVVNVGNWGDSPLESNVYGITSTCTSRDSVTRVMMYGAPLQTVISCYSYDVNPLTALLEDWEPTLEALVLADPRRGKPGADGYLFGMEFVGRRFRLPECLQKLTKLKALPFNKANGSEYGAQAWYWGSDLEDDPANPSVRVGVERTVMTQHGGVTWDLDKNQVMFSRAMFNVTKKYKDSAGKSKSDYVKSRLGITFGVELDTYLLHDTGHDAGSDVSLDFVGNAGLTLAVSREDLVKAQYTSHGIPVDNYGSFFDAVIFNEDQTAYVDGMGAIQPGGQPYTFTEAMVIRDDSPTLRKLASDILQEKSKRRRSYSVQIPYFTTAYREGYRCRVAGDASYVPDNYCITSVTHDLGEDHGTKLEIDNIKPPARMEITL